MTLKECNENIGNSVTYTPYKGCPTNQKEHGVIVSTNERGAFVRYKGETQGKLTRPEDLELG